MKGDDRSRRSACEPTRRRVATSWPRRCTGGERNRTPAGFADYRSFANRNVITNEVQNLDARWRVFGGVSVGTTLRAVAGDKSLKRTTVYTVQSGAANQSLNAEISSEVRKWDTRWGTGIGFLPGRHIELDLYYFHSFAAPGNQKLYASPYLDTNNSLVNSISNLNTQPVAANSMFQLAATWFF